jgi:hypothetical protein
MGTHPAELHQDVVDRLKTAIPHAQRMERHWHDHKSTSELCVVSTQIAEASDEIERLRDRIADLEAASRSACDKIGHVLFVLDGRRLA